MVNKRDPVVRNLEVVYGWELKEIISFMQERERSIDQIEIVTIEFMNRWVRTIQVKSGRLEYWFLSDTHYDAKLYEISRQFGYGARKDPHLFEQLFNKAYVQ